MKTNNLLDISFEKADTGEPVSLDEAKAHLRVTFSDDDDYITALITAAREAIEKYTGLSLVDKTITALIDNLRGGYELPYPPVKEVTSITDSGGNAITDIKTTGVFSRSIINQGCGLTVIYSAGYGEDVPGSLKQAILCEIAYLYENRGDVQVQDNAKLIKSAAAIGLAKMHRRQVWLL